jgi:hypothetical protein
MMTLIIKAVVALAAVNGRMTIRNLKVAAVLAVANL